MKNTIITLAIAVGSLVGISTEAEAGTKGDILRFVGKQLVNKHGGGGRHGDCGRPYLVRTSEICRRYERRTGRRPCGAYYHYNVTVITYRDFYSNGSSRTYTRTLS